MLVSIQSMLILSFTFSTIYWIFPTRWHTIKQYYLIAISAFFIFLYNPIILILLALFNLYTLVIYKLASLYRNQNLTWLIFLPLFLSNFSPTIHFPEWLVGNPRSAAAVNWIFLGMSYYSIKTFISVKQSLKANQINFSAMLLASCFFPTFVSGPIDGANVFDRSSVSNPFNLQKYVLGWSRIGIGLLKLTVILPWVQTNFTNLLLGFEMSANYAPNWVDFNVDQTLRYSLISFVILYLNFSGFTDFAVGIGKLFLLSVSENFRMPLLATSIQNFWQRWHLSLSSFISKYLYKPLLRKTGKPGLSMVLTFTLVGLWHKISIGYLIWGVAHGLLLAGHMKFSVLNTWVFQSNLFIRVLFRVLSTACTLTIVSLLSTLANRNGISEITAYIFALTRLE